MAAPFAQQPEVDDPEEQHDCQPNAPWAGWFWTAFWFVVMALVFGVWVGPWLADGVIP